MKYYNTLKKAIENGINAIDLMIATEVDFQLGETLVDVLDNDDEQHNKFDKVRSQLSRDVYLIEDREGNLFKLRNVRTNEITYAPRYRIVILNQK